MQWKIYMKKRLKKLDSCPKIISCGAADGKGIKISWTEVSQAEKYAVKRSDSFGGKFEIIGWTKALEYIDEETAENKTYWYRAYAVKKVSKKRTLVKESSSACAVVSSIPAPDSLRLEIGTDGKICIRWDFSEKADKFILLRRNGYSNQSVPVGETKENFFCDETLVSGQLYYYCVQSVVESDQGSKHGNLSEPFPVVNLDCGEVYSVKKRFGKANITARVVAGADGYILERGTDGENFEEIARNEGETAIRFTDKVSSARFYRTRAYKIVGEDTIISPASESVKVK